MNPFTETPGASEGTQEWSVIVAQGGRGGTVHYREADGCIPMSWEFGGNDVVAIIYFEKDAIWRGQYPWAAGRRSEIVRRVADEMVRQKAPRCEAEIDEQSGWINLRQDSQAARFTARPAPDYAFDSTGWVLARKNNFNCAGYSPFPPWPPPLTIFASIIT